MFLENDEELEEDLFEDDEFEEEFSDMEESEEYEDEESEIDEEDEEEELEEEEEELEEELPDEEPETQEAEPEPEKKVAAEIVEQQEMTPFKEIPFTVAIEVGRLKMSAKTLAELQPGNLLDVKVHTDQDVDIMVNGTKVARGELLRIGDRMGVRILEKS